MLVKNWMSKTVITVDVNDSMHDAMKLLKEHNIRMLPVLEEDELVGIITDRDIKRASASDATTLEIHELTYLMIRIKVIDVMNKDPITVRFDHTVEETAEVLLKNKISGAPVVGDKGNVVGIITQTDLFRALISLTGIGKKGIQFAFQLEDRPGSIKDVCDVIRSYNGRLVSILSTYERVPEGYRKVYIRAYNIDRSKLQQIQEEFKDDVALLYMVDHLENKREIFQNSE
ncbi:MAG: CBS domain-containing protein [Deltaproteobacteria bacterium]|nr:CBS domain-containing protein [Deltaproteobacteria bacterium]MBW2033910.1 CBS domain-containing protein [Deltaproteobacteria bacterium]MBW2114686.1 CBS domain-containing protein [Deltaproteobacteria bacterium]MBW2168162.1 CBS domain-containing protein [Deltaproteobacteria bacterium]